MASIEDAADLSLPGHPRIKLKDISTLSTFLQSELCSPELEIMAPRLWMMSKQSASNISALHRQRMKGREIIVTEEPRLHLVWIYDRIFIKPLPQYLLSYKFWKLYLLRNDSPLGAARPMLLRAALGYLRTYHFLIKHRSDFDRALMEGARLLPETTTWDQFNSFAEHLHEITDCEVSGRYAFGELRLSRLNFYSKIFLRKLHFQRTHYQYGAYFGRYYAPFLFVFGIVFVVLAAPQVEMAVEQVISNPVYDIWLASRVFCILAVIFCALSTLALAALWVHKIAAEWHFAIKSHFSKANSQHHSSDE